MTKGLRLMESRDWGRAALEFRNAIAQAPKSAEAHYQLALVYQQEGDLRSAYAGFTKALELDSTHAGAKLSQAAMMAALGDRAMIQQAADAARGLAGATKGADSAAALSTLALAELRLGQPEQAEQHWREALDRFPGNADAAMNLVALHYSRRDFAKAEAALQDAAQKLPKSSVPLAVLGAFYLVRDRLDDAQARLEAALRLDPADASALYTLAAVHQRKRDSQGAAAALARLSRLADPRYRHLHAVYLFHNGRRDEAISELTQQAESAPDNREAFRRLVAAYVLAGRTSDAEKLLNTQLGKNPGHQAALVARGALRLSTGRTAEAISDLTRALSADASSGEAHRLAGAAHVRGGSVELGRHHLAEALRLDPADLEARLAYARLQTSTGAAEAALSLLAEAPGAQRQDRRLRTESVWAQLALNRLAEADAELAKPGGDTTGLLLPRAFVALRRKNFEAARTLASRALEAGVAPDRRALDILYLAHAGAGSQPAAAVAPLRAVAERQPNSAEARFYLASTLMASGDAAGARTELERALTVDARFEPAAIALAEVEARDGKTASAKARLVGPAQSGHAGAMLFLARLEADADNREAAVEWYRRCLALDERNLTALNNLADLLVSQPGSSLDEALKWAQKAKALAPDDPIIDDTLGWVLYQRGDYQGAIGFLERATRAKSAVPSFHLSVAYLKAGDRPRGLEALTRGLQIDSKSPEAVQAAKLASELAGL